MTNTLEAVDGMVVTLRSLVEEVLQEDTRFRFEICTSEVLVNIVTHAQTKVSDAPVKIELDLKQGSAKIEIFDPVGAEPFDLRDHAKNLSEVDANAEGGRGLGLIMECADQVTYGPSGSCNSLKLEFWDS